MTGASLLALGTAYAQASRVTLLNVPIELTGDWQGSLPSAALAVVARMRDVSLAGLPLVSDQQPERIRVDDHASGPPSIWLHFDDKPLAWIIVDVEERDWCRLAYQFGHELGHVLANSWAKTAKGKPPTQWLEESIVEAFSIRGLGLLAASWEMDPPFPNDNTFGAAIRDYREKVIKQYATSQDQRFYGSLSSWFSHTQQALEKPGRGIDDMEGPAILAILAELERGTNAVVDIGALNRWPERTALPLEPYLNEWAVSCAELGAPGYLPAHLKALFGFTEGKDR